LNETHHTQKEKNLNHTLSKIDELWPVYSTVRDAQSDYQIAAALHFHVYLIIKDNLFFVGSNHFFHV